MKKLALTFSLLLLGGMTASATVIVDEFTSNSLPDTAGVGCGSAPASADNTGQNPFSARHMEVARTEGSNCISVDTSPGSLNADTALDFGGGTSGDILVTWNAAGPVNLSSETLFEFVLFYNHGGGPAQPGNTSSITFWICDAGACMSRTLNLSASFGPGTVSWDLTTFTNFAGVNLAAITNVRLTMHLEDGADVALDQIQATTPEPSTLALFGSALVGLALYRRRK